MRIDYLKFLRKSTFEIIIETKIKLYDFTYFNISSMNNLQ
jgi:hypothetical protein